MNEAFLYDAVRTPRGRGKKDGALHAIRPVDLARQVLVAIRERNSIDTRRVEDVILGCVTAIGEQGGNIAKTAAMFAGYDETVAGVTVNRFCGSGLEAVNQAAARVRAGSDELFVAGGVESMSRTAIGSDGGCSEATVTWRSTRSRATSSTRACSASTAAPTRSCSS